MKPVPHEGFRNKVYLSAALPVGSRILNIFWWSLSFEASLWKNVIKQLMALSTVGMAVPEVRLEMHAAPQKHSTIIHIGHKRHNGVFLVINLPDAQP